MGQRGVTEERWAWGDAKVGIRNIWGLQTIPYFQFKFLTPIQGNALRSFPRLPLLIPRSPLVPAHGMWSNLLLHSSRPVLGRYVLASLSGASLTHLTPQSSLISSPSPRPTPRSTT
jgi:hypothetical protein